MKTRLLHHVAAAALLLPVGPLLLATPAAAQQRPAVEIQALTIDADNGLMPGSTLRLTVRGTPDAGEVQVRLGSDAAVVPLREVAPGQYTGHHVVRRGERIDPSGLVTARLERGERQASRNFSFPASFQALAMGAAPGPAVTGTAIERLVLRSPGRPEAGSEIHYRLHGRPGGDAWIDIPGVISGVDLAEVQPGVYEGSYTVRRRDDPDAFGNATATLRLSGRVVTARVEGERVGRNRPWADRDRPVALRDDHAPQITELTPGNGDRLGDRGRVHIGARLGDEGSGIDVAGVRLRIDGRDVTESARISEEEIRFRDNLPPGRHTVEVVAADRARNTTTKTWSFDVVERADR